MGWFLPMYSEYGRVWRQPYDFLWVKLGLLRRIYLLQAATGMFSAKAAWQSQLKLIGKISIHITSLNEEEPPFFTKSPDQVKISLCPPITTNDWVASVQGSMGPYLGYEEFRKSRKHVSRAYMRIVLLHKLINVASLDCGGRQRSLRLWMVERGIWLRDGFWASIANPTQ